MDQPNKKPAIARERSSSATHSAKQSTKTPIYAKEAPLSRVSKITVMDKASVGVAVNEVAHVSPAIRGEDYANAAEKSAAHYQAKSSAEAGQGRSFKGKAFRASRRKQVSDRWKVSAWSKAGISTTVLLKDRETRRSLLFDCGGMGGISPLEMMEADVVLVSHTHADHCAGLFAHARSRFAQSRSAKYIVPKDSIEQLTKARSAFEGMDEKELKMDFIEVSPGDTVNLGKGLFVECTRTIHRVPSVGYLIYRDEKVLKEEYRNLSSEEKGELGRAGVKLSETIRIEEVAYSGDTTVDGLDPRMFRANLAIIECTFLNEKDRRLAEDTQHVLLSDLEAKLASCDINPNCQLLLMHFSARYSASQITSAVRQASLLPKRTACALAAFHSGGHADDDDSGIFFA